jgi:hypothetical protein
VLSPIIKKNYMRVIQEKFVASPILTMYVLLGLKSVTMVLVWALKKETSAEHPLTVRPASFVITRQESVRNLKVKESHVFQEKSVKEGRGASMLLLKVLQEPVLLISVRSWMKKRKAFNLTHGKTSWYAKME